MSGAGGASRGLHAMVKAQRPGQAWAVPAAPAAHAKSMPCRASSAHRQRDEVPALAGALGDAAVCNNLGLAGAGDHEVALHGRHSHLVTEWGGCWLERQGADTAPTAAEAAARTSAPARRNTSIVTTASISSLPRPMGTRTRLAAMAKVLRAARRRGSRETLLWVAARRLVATQLAGRRVIISKPLRSAIPAARGNRRWRRHAASPCWTKHDVRPSLSPPRPAGCGGCSLDALCIVWRSKNIDPGARSGAPGGSAGASSAARGLSR